MNTSTVQAGRFRGTAAVVAGAGHGIGLATARRLGCEGARVAMVDVSAERLAKAASVLSALGITHSTHHVDVAEPEEVDAFATELADRYDRVDALFSSVGVLLLDTKPARLTRRPAAPGSAHRVPIHPVG